MSTATATATAQPPISEPAQRWTVETGIHGVVVVDQHAELVAELAYPPGDDDPPTGHLIAASPDMLALLETIMEYGLLDRREKLAETTKTKILDTINNARGHYQ